MPNDNTFGWTFPAIRGIQAGREFYVSMCPLGIIPKIFIFDEETLEPELRAQRTLNKARVPQIAKYILDNPKDYVFSALTTSIDSTGVRFEAIGEKGEGKSVGALYIPLNSRFIINDGQHRRAGIERALKENPDLKAETIAVVFFLDRGLARCQQMFADLNRFGIRVNKSIGVLYDQRDYKSGLAKLLAFKTPVFKGLVEMERSSLSPRSQALFTLSSIYHATEELIQGNPIQDQKNLNQLASDYWTEIGKHIKEWGQVQQKRLSAGELRAKYIHSHGIVLQALGRLGNALLHGSGNWKEKLKGLEKIDWRRTNTRLWEGRVMIGGRISKAQNNVILTTNLLKTQLGLELAPDEKKVEAAFKKGK